jgi:hypothetical protein
VIPKTGLRPESGKGYNPVRGAKVIAYARHVLDRTAPLKKGSHVDSTGYASRAASWSVSAGRRQDHRAENAKQFVGYQGDAGRPSACCCSTTACTWTSASTAPRPSARATRPA